MKLYTEEEVKQMLIKTDMFTPLHIDHLMNETTPIELPSDEEIEELSYTYTLNKFGEVDDFIDARDGFEDGIKWMRDKIQGGNK